MKHRNIVISLTFVIGAFFAMTVSAHAATITFRDAPILCRGNAVTLGDVAVVTPDRGEDAAEIESLKAVVLFPAPIPGKDRTVAWRDVYDYLNMRGVRVGQHTFAGAGKVTITAAPQTATQTAPSSAATSAISGNDKIFVRRDAAQNSVATAVSDEEEAVRHAVLTFLRENIDADAPWRIDTTMSPEGQRRLADAGGINGIRAIVDENRNRPNVSQYDPAEQWLGRQRFELQCRRVNPETGMHRTMTVEVNVSLPKAVVVTRHVIPKGKILSAADVKLSYLTEDQTPSRVTKSRTVNGITTQRGREPEIDPDTATRIDEVVGKAAIRALRNDTPVQFSQIEKPVLVKRSEAVTLFVRNGGITIKMTARAKEDGREGELITVESLTDKQTSLARVVDYGTVEVEMTRSEITGAAKLASVPAGNPGMRYR